MTTENKVTAVTSVPVTLSAQGAYFRGKLIDQNSEVKVGTDFKTGAPKTNLVQQLTFTARFDGRSTTAIFTAYHDEHAVLKPLEVGKEYVIKLYSFLTDKGILRVKGDIQA